MEETNRMTSDIQPGNTEKAETSNIRKVYYYYCQQEGHYSSQFSVKINKKQPTVNMVIVEVTNVQQVTTKSKAKTTKWET